MTSLLPVVRSAARAAGLDLLDRFRRPPQGLSTKSDPSDFVSDADRSSEQLIASYLLAAFPEDGFLGEESGRTASGKRSWLVDPLDGTANYLHGLPFWAVSIAALTGDQLDCGLVFCPPLRSEWSTEQDELFLPSDPLPRFASSLSDAAVLARANLDPASDRAALLDQAFRRAGSLRYFGSAALSLAFLAEGCLDLVYFEYSRLSDWDVAAGQALCLAAGLSAFWLPPVSPGLPRRFLAGPSPLVSEWLSLTDLS